MTNIIATNVVWEQLIRKLVIEYIKETWQHQLNLVQLKLLKTKTFRLYMSICLQYVFFYELLNLSLTTF